MTRMWNPSSPRIATLATGHPNRREICASIRMKLSCAAASTGLVVQAGNGKGSELLHRVSLPVGDDKVMPPEGKPHLAPEEVKLIELWITAGASPTLAADAIKDAPTTIAPVAAEVTFVEIDPAAVAKLRSPQSAASCGFCKKHYPDVLQYESRASADAQ